VGADLVITDGPMMAHVSVIGKYQYRYRFRDLQQLSLHVVICPVVTSKPDNHLGYLVMKLFTANK